jgi:hypothetical protein
VPPLDLVRIRYPAAVVAVVVAGAVLDGAGVSSNEARVDDGVGKLFVEVAGGLRDVEAVEMVDALLLLVLMRDA